MEATTAEFAATARTLGRELRSRGLIAPGFRCPPRIVGVDRSLRRWEGGATVSIRVKSRPLTAVVADMIEGSVVANKLVSPRADRLRTELWEAISPILGTAGIPSPATTRQVA
ncbi:MAG: hypothetical protein ACKOI2_02475 [Actinomycetota bacterium]